MQLLKDTLIVVPLKKALLVVNWLLNIMNRHQKTYWITQKGYSKKRYQKEYLLYQVPFGRVVYVWGWVCPGGVGMSSVVGTPTDPPSPGHGIPWDMVDKRAVRILLECFLVAEEHLHLKLQL